jgi:hypothetical protein
VVEVGKRDNPVEVLGGTLEVEAARRKVEIGVGVGTLGLREVGEGVEQDIRLVVVAAVAEIMHLRMRLYISFNLRRRSREGTHPDM